MDKENKYTLVHAAAFSVVGGTAFWPLLAWCLL